MYTKGFKYLRGCKYLRGFKYLMGFKCLRDHLRGLTYAYMDIKMFGNLDIWIFQSMYIYLWCVSNILFFPASNYASSSISYLFKYEHTYFYPNYIVSKLVSNHTYK